MTRTVLKARSKSCGGASWLLAVGLSLTGCTLSAPKESELFSPASAGDGGQRDAATDASDGAKPDLDSGAASDAGSDTGKTVDEDGGSEAGQDAGSTLFDPAAGLVVHYKFNETSGDKVHDFAGDKDALIFGSPNATEQWISAGRIDGALKLAGTAAPDGGTGHYVELPQGLLLGRDACSIALWLNRAGGPMWQRVFDFGSGMPSWIYLTAVGGNGLPIVAGRTTDLIFADFKPIEGASAMEGELKITQTIPVGTWTHFVLTWSASELKVYLNGKLVAQAVTRAQTTPSGLGNTTQDYLGRSQFPADPYFNGMLDDFRFYDHVLSESDVTQLYGTP